MTRFLLALLSSLLLMRQASAGLITVFTEVNYPGPEIPASGGYFTWDNAPVPTVVSGTTGSGVALTFWDWNAMSVPATPVQLSVNVGDGTNFKQLTVNATISGQVIPNTFEWQFNAMPVEATFGNTVVTVDYHAVLLPTEFPSTYYTSFGVADDVTVTQTTPEPSSAVLLAGLTLGGLVIRRFRRIVVPA